MHQCVMVHMHIHMIIGVATLSIGFEGGGGQASYEMGMILHWLVAAFQTRCIYSGFTVTILSYANAHMRRF